MAAVLFNSKELKILKMICNEKSCAEIADSLEMSVRSAERFKKALLKKTRTRTALGLYKWALKQKLVK